MGKLDIRKLAQRQRSGTAPIKLVAVVPLFAVSVLAAVCLLFAAAGGDDTVSHRVAGPAHSPPARPASSPENSRVLINGQSSTYALASRFLDCLARKDRESIKNLRLTRDEFCNYYWPEAPASRIPNVTCDFAWNQATLRSDGGLSELLADHSGKRYELVSISFGGMEEWQSYKIYKDPRLTIKDERGATREVKLFGSVFELDGRVKLFSFVFS